MHARRSVRTRYLVLLGALGLLPAAACSSNDPGVPCSDSTPVLIGSADSGYATCGEGYVHRRVATTCPAVAPRNNVCDDGSGAPACTTDTDCTARPNGFCDIDFSGLCTCSYGCTEDAECGDGAICLCGETASYCVAASCRSDQECEGDLLCTEYVSEPGCGGIAFACQSPEDTCQTNADCPSGEECTIRNGARICEQPTCAIGRPFLVDGVEVQAPAASRDDWTGDATPSLDGLDAHERRVLAQHYTRMGLMEHASVAAFARFTLQLLDQGAPAELVEMAGDAMRDETEHARLAFALASAYAGAPTGPGQLDTQGALEARSPQQILELVVLEGCIGETVAAVEAAEAAAHASDPVVRAVLDRVTADEIRHAELAWRYVAWLLEEGPADTAEVLLGTIEAARVEALAPYTVREGDGRFLRHGVVGETLRRSLRREVLDAIVAPCAARLVAGRVARRQEDRRSA
ncbi:MAG: ferritin-like domain-containing protein [Polyangiaceae bacterium]